MRGTRATTWTFMSLLRELQAIEEVQKGVGTCPVAPEACGSLNASQLLLQVNFNDVSNNLTYLVYFTLVESSAIGVEWIYNRTSVVHPVVDLCHRDPHLIVLFWSIVFPAISWASPWWSSYWLDHECFSLGSCWCLPLDV